jgi:hypothetical protein
MNISIQSAARGAPELSYWPVFAACTIFVSDQSMTNLFMILMLVFTSSVMYLPLKQSESQIKNSKKILEKKSVVSRGGRSKLFEYTIVEVGRIFHRILPNSKIKRSLIYLSILLNAFTGLYMYAYLASTSIIYPSANLLNLLLIFVPTLYVCNIFVYYSIYN